METYQKRIKNVIDYINKNLIAEVPSNIYDPEERINAALTADGKIGNANKRFIPVTTTLLVLNSCLGNNTLIEGGSGTGKTKLASVVGSLFYQIPYSLFERRKVVGTPGATVNEIYATHDLAELNRGNDVAFLYLPFYLPFLIIDELNRYSELEQNRIREGVAAEVWNYANHSWKIARQLVVSAINPESYGGTFILNENLLDNYSIALEPAYYNPLFHANLVECAEERIKRDLDLESAVDELVAFYSSHKNEPDLIYEKISDLQKKTIKAYTERGIPFIANGYIDEIEKNIEAMRFTPEGELFFQSVLAEMTYSHEFGRLRFDDPVSSNSHDQKYLCTKLKEGLAGRFLKDWRKISKAIAWYFGKDKADIEDIKAGFIYSANRRIKPEEEFYQQTLTQPRNVSVNYKMAKNLMEIAWNNYSDLSANNNEGFNAIRKAIRIINGEEKGNVSETIKILEKVDHPLAMSILEAIALEEYCKSQQIYSFKFGK